ncbi:MAG TPA: hypothetical protein VF148_08490 [Acidimicrobiia bacterium]
MQTLTASATVVLAAVAVLAYCAARGQIREARQLRKASHHAYVVVHAEGDKPTRAIYLVLENTRADCGQERICDVHPAPASGPLSGRPRWVHKSVGPTNYAAGQVGPHRA